LTSLKHLLQTDLKNRFSPLIVILVYLYGAVLGGVNGTLNAISIGLFIGVIPFLGYYPIAASRINISTVIQVSGGAVSLYAALKYLSNVKNIVIPVLDGLAVFIDEYSALAISEKKYFGENAIYVSTGAAPILFVAFSLTIINIFFKRFYFLIPLAVLNGFAIVTSGSRALWFTSSAMLGFIVLQAVGRLLIKMLFALFYIFLTLYLNEAFEVAELLSNSDFSNLVKITWIQSYLAQCNVEGVLFGGGIGVEINNVFFGITAIQTEITLLEAVRMFGLVFSVLLFGAVTMPSVKIKDYSEKALPIAVFLLYLIFSFTNPVLFNGIGALVVIWYWVEICNKPAAR
jgi:hypothetical protein